MPPLTRRSLAGALGVAAGAAFFRPRVSIAAPARRRHTPEEVLLNSNENPYGPSPRALEAAEAVGTIANRYPDALEEDVRQAIAAHHRVPVARVVLGCGSSEILQMADLAFSGPDRKVVVAEPTFEAVLAYAKAEHAGAIKVPLTSDFRHDLSAMAAACGPGIGLVYVCNPNNPTGTIVTGDEMAAFASKVPRTTTILVDEAYHHFVEDARYRSACELIDRFPNVVVARTFSKIYGMAGLRLGYAVGSEEKIAQLANFASWSNANAAVLSAALASLSDPELVLRQRKLLNDTRRWLVSELDRQGRRTIPSETNFVMIHLGRDVAPVIEAFRGKKILVGRKFPSMPDWLRVTVGKPEETRAFAAALAEIVPMTRPAAA